MPGLEVGNIDWSMWKLGLLQRVSCCCVASLSFNSCTIPVVFDVAVRFVAQYSRHCL